jgi:hypothetical protein
LADNGEWNKDEISVLKYLDISYISIDNMISKCITGGLLLLASIVRGDDVIAVG